MSQHWYNSKGELVAPQTAGSLPSVTTVLSVMANPGLQSWRDRVGAEEADRVGKEATDRGTLVHESIEEYIALATDRFRCQNLDSSSLAMVEGFLRWESKVAPTLISSELFLWSPERGYAGRCDLICQIDGEWWLIDFKTSKRLRPEYGLQLAAYAKIWEDEHPGIVLRRGVLQLTDQIKRGYRFKEYTGDDYWTFQCLLYVLQWKLSVEPVRIAGPQWAMK